MDIISTQDTRIASYKIHKPSLFFMPIKWSKMSSTFFIGMCHILYLHAYTKEPAMFSKHTFLFQSLINLILWFFQINFIDINKSGTFRLQATVIG